jgi:hypothetical protein
MESMRACMQVGNPPSFFLEHDSLLTRASRASDRKTFTIFAVSNMGKASFLRR